MKKLSQKYLGWIGAILLVVMYLLNSFGAVHAQSLLYQITNLLGAVLIVIYSLVVKAVPNAFINIVWSIGAIVAIILILVK